MIKIVLLIIFSLNFLQSLKVTDFCNQIINKTINKCEQNTSKHKYNCDMGLCSLDRNSCQSMKLFSTAKDTQKDEKMYLFIQNNFIAFTNLIKKCHAKPAKSAASAKYKWNAGDFCLNTKECFRPSIHRLWSIQMPIKCNCTGKYSHKCNHDYCSLNKHACHGFNKKWMGTIKKC